MSDQNASNRPNARDESLRARRTTLGLVLENLSDEPSRGLSAWLRTTAGVVALLLALQLVTGLLLAFYYVPSSDSAYTTVAYVEKVVPAGSWLRALHFYGSQLLPVALVLHLAQMLCRGAYARLLICREPDAEHVETTLAADAAHSEVNNASDAAWPRTREMWWRVQLARNAVVAGVVFLLLALYAYKYPAPLGPAAEAAPPGYLPRPGAQFIWLFQLLKLLPKTAGSVVAFFLPALLLAALAWLPFTRMAHAREKSRRRFGQVVLSFTILLVAALTTAAYLQDSRDPRARDQLANKSQKETEFRAAPFTPNPPSDP